VKDSPTLVRPGPDGHDRLPPWIATAEPGHVYHIVAAREHPPFRRVAASGKTLADTGRGGTRADMRTQVKGHSEDCQATTLTRTSPFHEVLSLKVPQTTQSAHTAPLMGSLTGTLL